MRAKYMCSARVQICVYLFVVVVVDTFPSVLKFAFSFTFVIVVVFVVVFSIYFRQIYLFRRMGENVGIYKDRIIFDVDEATMVM